MAGRVEGKVALVTGGARGQGRSHAVRLAEEGADVVVFDVCADASSTPYRGGTREELDETIALVEKAGRQAVGVVGDVRDQSALDAAVATAVSDLGGLDIVVANAGIFSWGLVHELGEEQWTEMIDVNLNGSWRTIKASVPALLERGAGSIVIINSGAGLSGPNNLAHYAAAKHGLVGLMRSASNELSPFGIRVNSVHPSQVDTPMIMHDALYGLFRPDLDAPTREDIVETSVRLHTIPVPWVDPVDVSNAVLFLCSDEARYLTGVSLPVDAGGATKTSY